MADYIPNHVERGLSRVISQYRNATKLKAWIATYLKELQKVEDAAYEVATERGIDGVGVQLDVVGKVVNRPRGSLADDDYRIALRAEIRVLRSDGRMTDIIEVADIAIPPGYTFTADDFGVATIKFTINEPVLFDPLVLFRALQRTKAGGVRFLFEVMLSPVDEYFVWEPDEGTTAVGFGDAVSGDGGRLVCVLGG